MAEALAFDVAVDLAPHPVIAPIETYQQSYLYTPSGVLLVPDEYIVHDMGTPIDISPLEWRALGERHFSFSASAFLNGRTISSDQIVVLDNEMSRPPDHGTLWEPRVKWCVRVAVDGGCNAFAYTFGDNFLWELPGSVCNKMLAKLATSVTSPQEHVLMYLRPNAATFCARDWPELFFLHVVEDYYDCVFALSVRPDVDDILTLAQPPPRIKQARESFDRPFCVYDAAPRMSLPLLPCEIQDLIVDAAASELAAAKAATHWNGFLALRSVCRSWRDAADAAGVRMLQQPKALLKRAISDRTMASVVAARDAIFDARLTTVAFMREMTFASSKKKKSNLSIYNLMRLRCHKKPGSLPSPLKRQRQSSAACTPPKSQKRAHDAHGRVAGAAAR